jgi:hypothetical protein
VVAAASGGAAEAGAGAGRHFGPGCMPGGPAGGMGPAEGITWCPGESLQCHLGPGTRRRVCCQVPLPLLQLPQEVVVVVVVTCCGPRDPLCMMAPFQQQQQLVRRHLVVTGRV